MRIDKIEIQNFKRFEKQTLELHPQFTLLVGDNGAGKTTLLDALAVAAAVWLVKVPDSTLASSGRNILTNEIRLDPKKEGDRIQFNECKPVAVLATGQIAGRDVHWCRQIRKEGARTTNAEAKEALAIIADVFKRVAGGDKVLADHAQAHLEALKTRWQETDLSEGRVRVIIARMEGVLGQLPAAIKQAHERIIGERKVRNEDKILSLYDDSINVIVRGKADAEVEFGNKLWLGETREGIIVDYMLYEDNPSDPTLIKPVD